MQRSAGGTWEVYEYALEGYGLGKFHFNSTGRVEGLPPNKSVINPKAYKEISKYVLELVKRLHK